MIKIFKLILVFTITVFAADAEIDIIKKSSTLPKISISVASNTMKKTLTNKVKEMIKKDLS